MALTLAIVGKGVISVGDSTTETWGKTGLISAVQDETDIVLQGTNAASSKASGKNGWIYFDIGSGNELDFTPSTGSEKDQLIYMWINCTTLGGLDTLALDSLALQVGSSTTAFSRWTIGGSDGIGNGYTGGWMCVVIDPQKTATTTGGGGATLSSVRYFGIYIDMNGSAKAENIIIDSISVGRGLRITGTDATGWQEVSDYCNAFATRAWGQFQEPIPGIYNVFGTIYIGDSTQTAITSLTDGGRIFRFGDFEYYTGSAWVSSLPSGFNGIIVEDAASYATTFTDGTIVGTDKGRSGSVFIGSSNANTTFDLYGGSATGSITKLYGTTLQGIDGGIVWGNDSDHHCYSVTFNNCGQFDPVGGVKIRNCTLSEYSGTASALKWNANIDIKSCSFIANIDGTNDPHAIEHPSVGTFTYDGLTFSGNDYDIDHQPSSTDADNYNESNRDSDQALNNSTTAVGQSVTGDGNKLAKIQFFLSKSGSPTGSAYAKLYAHSGTFGSSSIPTGVALATSNALDVSTLDGTPTLYALEFEDPHYTLVNATKYVIVIEYTNGDASNYVLVGYDAGAGAGHGGNMSVYTGSWTAQANDDVCFHMFTGGIIVINSTNGSNPDEAKVEYTGTPTGVISINNSVYLRVYVKDESDTAIQNAQTAIWKTSDETELMNEDTVAGTGLAEETFNYPGSNVDIKIRVRKSSPGDTYYEDFDGIGTITADGFTLNVRLIEDTKQT
jgi:hypothetical protein